MSLAGKRIFVTGGSRGIGLAIALRAARDGASIAIAAKTAEVNPKLPGTIYSAAAEIEAAGGVALPIQCDLRDETQIEAAIAQAAAEFGGLDILINNASAINLTKTEATPAKRFDLMFDVNVRGTFLTSQAAIPHLRESAKAGRNPHILTLSPPLSMKAKWFQHHVAYTMAKYGMSMCVLGMSTRAIPLVTDTLEVRTLRLFAPRIVIVFAFLFFSVVSASPNSNCTYFGDLVKVEFAAGKLFTNSAWATALWVPLNTSPTASSKTFNLRISLGRNREESL